MKIKSIKLTNFKRFTDLTIEGLPETAKLVVMIGPNGCGKSSVFDALHLSRIVKGELTKVPFDSYYIKADPSQLRAADLNDIDIRFYPATPETPDLWRKCVHVRSAYRHDLNNRNISFPHAPAIDQQPRFVRLTQNDPAIAINYGRLLSLWIEHSSTLERSSETLGKLQDEVFGGLRDAMARLFRYPELILENLGNPPSEASPFRFKKKVSQGFSYENLSSGEKTALDLILDIIVFKAELGDTVFCIDEPELHIHTKLQGQLLEELYNLIPEKSQLWIATHSIGMVRKAQDLWHEDSDSVIFLDFDGHDFDTSVTLTPATPDSEFWARTYKVALDDLAELVAPQRIMLCESKAQDPIKGFDAACYNQIFGSRYPDTRFISIGGRKDVEKANTHLIPVIEAIAGGVEVLRLRDRDRATEQDIVNNAKKGIRTLSREYIEKYLTDNEVLSHLCISEGKSDKVKRFLAGKDTEIEKVINNDKIRDKRRPIVQRIQQQAEQILGLIHSGDTVESFMRDILAPLIQPGMKVYEELHEDIFGE